jgi:predicted Zn-dependent peptidase
VLDRKKGPMIKSLEKVALPEIIQYTLDNNVRVAESNIGLQDIVKVDILFHVGRVMEDKWMASRATAYMLRNDTALRSAKEVEELLDFYGTSIKMASGMDYSYISFVSLNKFFDKVSSLVQEMLYQPKFSQEELKKFQKTGTEKLKIDLSKNDITAYREHTALLFGNNHPYGYNSNIEDLNKLTIADIQHHFDNYYGSDNCIIVISGKITPEIRKQVAEKFGKINKISKTKPYQESHANLTNHRVEIKSKNNLQVAMRMGKKLFSRMHEDNPHFYMLNTILGGYFGSRLMSEIREKKGYTYNIYSNMDQMIHDGYFYISSEMDPKYIEKSIKAIYIEIDRLKAEQISDGELKMVKNYVMGSMLNLLDGPFNVGSYIRMIKTNELEPSFYDGFIDKILSTSKSDIQEMAIKHFDKSQMLEVIVGKSSK